MFYFLLLIVLILLIPFFAFKRCRTQREEIDACLILGCPTHEDGSLRRTMIDRLNHALSISQTVSIQAFILCGGKAHNEYSEAQAMADYLKDKTNIPLILEENSTTTYENLKYASLICQKNDFHRIGIVTSSSHAPRSYALAKKFFDDISMYEADETMSCKKWVTEYVSRWTYLIIEAKNKLKGH